jgi:hypothetical protein
MVLMGNPAALFGWGWWRAVEPRFSLPFWARVVTHVYSVPVSSSEENLNFYSYGIVILLILLQRYRSKFNRLLSHDFCIWRSQHGKKLAQPACWHLLEAETCHLLSLDTVPCNKKTAQIQKRNQTFQGDKFKRSVHSHRAGSNDWDFAISRAQTRIIKWK